MIKRTFVLDRESVAYLDRMAGRTGMPRSQIVREALRVYGEQYGRLSEEERLARLKAFDDAAARVPDRPRSEVEAELQAVGEARRRGGRGERSRPGGGGPGRQ
ncbi:MAG: ribbon-helix-helix protein, CopG family [Gemmatimonadota bacterium]|jgi:predicted transcriptional regulator